MKRRWFDIRVRFHDWMWDGGSLPSLPRYLARRLPLYFSDPYYTRKSPTGPEVAVIYHPAGGLPMTPTSPWITTAPAPTHTASGTTTTWRWNPGAH